MYTYTQKHTLRNYPFQIPITGLTNYDHAGEGQQQFTGQIEATQAPPVEGE
jgi:hypothetical protein